jgi:hypothetical protein
MISLQEEKPENLLNMYKMDNIGRELHDFMKFYGKVMYSTPSYQGYLFKHKSGRYTQFFVHLS